MLLITWIVELIYVIYKICNTNKAIQILEDANQIISGYETSKEIQSQISDLRLDCLLIIALTLAFCLAITFSYEKSKTNKQDIEVIKEFLQYKANSQNTTNNDSPT